MTMTRLTLPVIDFGTDDNDDTCVNADDNDGAEVGVDAVNFTASRSVTNDLVIEERFF